MPGFSIQKSITVAAPAAEVFAAVRDFRRWPRWSPWLVAEPDCPLEFAPDGGSYAWDGKIVGSGKMEVLDETPPGEIRYRLTFLKPWKSESAVAFRFEPDAGAGDGGTRVTWSMDGSLPFFMFWMKRMMTAFIGMDYERGLRMLKDDVETGGVPSELEFAGLVDHPGCRFAGRRVTCPISEIGPQMEEGFTAVRSALGDAGIEAAGPPLSIYHQWDMVGGVTSFTMAVPVSAGAVVPDGLEVGELAPARCYVVRHCGEYRHLGNAWSSGMMHARGKVFRQRKAAHPFEVYEHEPEPENGGAAVTAVHFPAVG